VHELFGNQGHTTDEEPPLLQIEELGRDAIVTNTRMYQVRSLEGSESGTLRGTLVRMIQQDERYGRYTLAFPPSDSPHDTDMTITTYALLTLLIRHQFLPFEHLVPNTVDHTVDFLSILLVKHGLYALPVGRNSLCILGKYGASDVRIPIPVEFLRDARVVANSPDLAEGFCKREQGEGRRLEQEPEDGWCVVVKQETGEGDLDEEAEGKADPTRDEARPGTICILISGHRRHTLNRSQTRTKQLMKEAHSG